MRRQIRVWSVRVLAMACILAAQANAYAQTTVAIQRVIPAGFYTPGSTLDVKVTFSRTGTGTVSALGLEDILPAGWTFNGVVPNAAEPAPAIAPQPDVNGTLAFAWLPIPAFPFSFTYRVNVPAGQTGIKTLGGKALYRIQGNSTPQQSPPIESTIGESTTAGTLTVTLGPAQAVAGGARWTVDGGPELASGAVTSLPIGDHILSFKTISGWITPPNQTLGVLSGQLTSGTGKYELPPLATRCNIDGLGKVDATDVQLVIRAALRLPVAYNCDVTRDGLVNAMDVQLVIRAALGLPLDTKAQRLTKSP